MAIDVQGENAHGTGKAQWLAGVFGWQSAGELVLPLCLATLVMLLKTWF
jgi:hypothetical protein